MADEVQSEQVEEIEAGSAADHGEQDAPVNEVHHPRLLGV
jgi:hypothetical protein